jgi:ABC-type arginine transport system permease subunit
MILTGIVAGIITALTVLLGLLILFYIGFRKIRRIFNQFVEPAGENQPSPFAMVIDNIAVVFSTRITNTIKGSLMGMASVDARNERSLTGELAAGLAASKIPALGAIMAAIPSLRKRLIKNPELAGLASQLLAGMAPPAKNGEHEPHNQIPLTL